jgi:hypothetical protein
MMKKLIGLFASVALMGSGVALANEDWKQHDKQQTQGQGGAGEVGSEHSGSMQQEPGAIGGSGQPGQRGMSQQTGAGQQLGANELMGRVVKKSRKTVWLDHQGAIVPLTINKDTRFTQPGLTRIQDINEGDEIRASFEVKETENIATTVQRADAGVGGGGQDDFFMDTDPSISPDPSGLPPSPVDGTGGSGSDLTPPDIGSEGTGSDLGSDTNVDEGTRTGDY